MPPKGPSTSRLGGLLPPLWDGLATDFLSDNTIRDGLPRVRCDRNRWVNGCRNGVAMAGLNVGVMNRHTGHKEPKVRGGIIHATEGTDNGANRMNEWMMMGGMLHGNLENFHRSS